MLYEKFYEKGLGKFLGELHGLTSYIVELILGVPPPYHKTPRLSIVYQYIFTLKKSIKSISYSNQEKKIFNL